MKVGVYILFLEMLACVGLLAQEKKTLENPANRSSKLEEMSTSSAEPDANGFGLKIYALTKRRDYQAYAVLFHPNCHERSVTRQNFELRSDLLNKLALAPGTKPEAIPFPDYKSMMRKRGAPPGFFTYTLEPSHVVIVRGTIPGVAGGDHVALNPIVKLAGSWKLLDGDCLSTAPTDSHPKR